MSSFRGDPPPHGCKNNNIYIKRLDRRRAFIRAGSGLDPGFWLMRMINLSHGAFYLLGGYIGYAVCDRLRQLVYCSHRRRPLDRALRLNLRADHALPRAGAVDLPETLLTVALSMIIADVCLSIWGGHSKSLTVPPEINPRFLSSVSPMGVFASS